MSFHLPRTVASLSLWGEAPEREAAAADKETTEARPRGLTHIRLPSEAASLSEAKRRRAFRFAFIFPIALGNYFYTEACSRVLRIGFNLLFVFVYSEAILYLRGRGSGLPG